MLTRLPMFSSSHMRAPPAPQQKPALLAASHLDLLHAGHGAEHGAGLVDDAVVPAEIAGVVVGDLARVPGAGRELARLHQVLEQLGVVDHFVVAAECRVLVLDGVEAVRAAGDDLLGADLVERGDVELALLLVEVFVAQTTDRVTGAGLLRTRGWRR